jgi:hypothetical protein
MFVNVRRAVANQDALSYVERAKLARVNNAKQDGDKEEVVQ